MNLMSKVLDTSGITFASIGLFYRIIGLYAFLCFIAFEKTHIGVWDIWEL